MENYLLPIPDGVQKFTWRHIRHKNRDLSIDDFFFPEDFQHYCMKFGLNLPVEVLVEFSKQGVKRLSDYQNVFPATDEQISLARACACVCAWVNSFKINFIYINNNKFKNLNFKRNSLFQL